ncbi:MAG: EpsD family peptidyl-prolyl cis-trans isomerase [Methylotenera sp.]|nr:EpsD family peptidyl-prolyl cis-trans isomerase [Methylotenera sp.]MDP2404410.1 EpsD family peptidyl-prolyl cis-trans isomerase [Methylotenera sp.]MDZ4222317.1 EpsD family peptidyl-prolyl cis-trans isomerase [Methylotenera sp.]
MRFTNKYLLLTLVVASVFTSACGKKDQAEKSELKTQVVAKVNGDEISIHQVNFQLSRMGQVNETQGKQVSEQILTRLVDQQLLKQQALESKLDRDPKILQALESSKDQILAQAYLDQLISKAAKPTKTEIDTFYQEHSELFANRRIFRLQELVVDISKDKFAEVEAGLKDIKNINEIAVWLKAKNHPFTANSNVSAAEQLPLDMLKKLQPLKDGDLMLVPTERSLNVLHLVASQSKPISRENATPFIEQYFLNQNKSKLAKQEMDSLKSKAKIEFVGAFSDMKISDDSVPVSNSTGSEKMPPKDNLTAKPATEVEKAAEAAVKPNANQANIDKGLSGL